MRESVWISIEGDPYIWEWVYRYVMVVAVEEVDFVMTVAGKEVDFMVVVTVWPAWTAWAGTRSSRAPRSSPTRRRLRQGSINVRTYVRQFICTILHMKIRSYVSILMDRGGGDVLSPSRHPLYKYLTSLYNLLTSLYDLLPISITCYLSL